MDIKNSSMGEWQDASRFVLKQLDDILQRLGRSDALRTYMQEMKGYPRVLYMCAAWIDEAALRFNLGTAFCIHSCGLKLIDDLIDGDQDLSPADLVAGHVFCETASDIYSRELPGHRLSHGWSDTWMPIYEYVFQEPDNVITSYPVWLDGAVRKSGNLMAAYCRAAHVGDADAAFVDLAADAMNAIGVLYMISDDLRDHTLLDERQSNLVELIRTGEVDAADVLATLNDIRARVERACAARAPAFSFWPMLEIIHDKCVQQFGQLGAARTAMPG